jgi:hypothetical protein
MSKERIIDMGPAEIVTVSASTLAGVEVDRQIATAKSYPRNMRDFDRKASDLVERHMAMSEPGEGLHYSLPRGGKLIEGPNVRLAEIIVNSWGNIRAGARPTGEEDRNVIVQGVCHDLESNVAITVEVKRRITRSTGQRYEDDMIQTTTNAACSIALRNVVFKSIPKAYWWPYYQRARQIAAGPAKDLPKARKWIAEWCAKNKVTEKQCCDTLGVEFISKIGLQDLVSFKGILAAIKEGETTIAKAFQGKGAREPGEEPESVIREKKPSDTISYETACDMRSQCEEIGVKVDDVLRSMRHSGTLETLPVGRQVDFNKALSTHAGK